MRRFWHFLAVAVLTVLLFPLTATYLTGDVSRYLPQGTFAQGADGKDQIIMVSAVATLLVAIILAASVLAATIAIWRRLRTLS